jgi:hypothetical protein
MPTFTRSTRNKENAFSIMKNADASCMIKGSIVS